MARKTLGKMEFEQLIDSLKEQNKGQLAAQQETTKSIQNLQAYFLKQDRAETRKRLEDQMEQRKDAEKVPGKQKGLFDKKIPTKGIFGKLMDFFLTGALGTAGKGLFRSLWSGVKFSGGFFKGLAGFMGGLILAPQIWDSIKKGLDEGDSVTDVVDKSISHFLKNTSLVEGMSAAALIGLGVAGPKGAVAAAITFGALKGVSSIIGKEKTIGDFFTGNVGVFESGLAGAGLGALAGFSVGAKFGLPGAMAGLLVGAGLGALAGVLVSKETKLNPFPIFTAVLGGFGGAMLGLKAGAMLGMVGGPVGMIAGALLGAALGLALGSFLTGDSNRTQKALSAMADKGSELAQLEDIETQGGTLDETQLARKKELHEGMAKDLQESGVASSGQTAMLSRIYGDKGDNEYAGSQKIIAVGSQVKANEMLDKLNDVFGTNAKTLGEILKTDKSRADRGLPLITKRDLKYKANNKEFNIPSGTPFTPNLFGGFVDRRSNETQENMAYVIREIGNAFVTGIQAEAYGYHESDLQARQNFLKGITNFAEYAKGYGAFDSPQIIQVGDQPKSEGQELVLTEKKFNRIINDIILKNGLKRDKKDLKLEMAEEEILEALSSTAPQLNQVDDQPKSERPELVLTEKNFNRIINDIILNNGIKRDREDMNIGMANSQELPLSIPQIKQIDDQPTAQGQELVLTEKKFNRIINDIMENNRLKHDKEDMNISMARSQGAPPIMPQVTNNNVSNQNVLQTEIMPSFNFDIMRDALPA